MQIPSSSSPLHRTLHRLLLLLCFVCFGLASAPVGCAQVRIVSDNPGDDPMIGRVRSGQVSVAKAIQRLRALEKAAASKKPARGDRLRPMLWAAACWRATAAELRELGALLAKFPTEDESSSLYDCYVAYTSAALVREMEKLKRNPPKLSLPATAELLPVSLQTAAPELQDAWKAWSAVLAPGAKLLKAAREAGEKIEAAPPGEIGPLVRKIAAEEPGDVLQDVLLCDDSNFYYRKTLHAHTAALVLLRKGKVEEGLAMACSTLVQARDSEWGSRVAYVASLSELLTAVGLDWEPIFAGALIAPELPEEERLVERENDWSENEAWAALSRLGSARGVALGRAIIREGKGDAMEADNFLFFAAGPPPKKWVEDEASDDPRDLVRTKRLPAEGRAALLAEIAARLDPGVPLERLERTLEHFSLWLTTELQAPLRKLLAHPNYRIASLALWHLEEMKLAGPGTTIAAAEPSPLRVRLLVDGKPLASQSVRAGPKPVSGKPEYKTYEQIETDAHGRISYDLSDVLEPEKISEFGLHYFRAPSPPPKAKKPKKGKSAEEAKTAAHRWKGVDAFFAVDVKAALHGELEFNIETKDLEIGLQAGEGLAKETEVVVKVCREDGGDFAEVRGKAEDSVLFEGLGPGRYRVQIEGKGFMDIEELVGSGHG